MTQAGYQALSHGAAIVDLSARGRIRVTGEDRVRLLHAMCTNHVQQMKPGDGVYAFFLNAQGRILSDAYIFCFEDHFLLDTEPETRRSLFEHLDHYIIADDVTLEDITEQTFCVGIEGPQAKETATRAGIPAPHHRASHLRWNETSAAAVSWTGEQGVRVWGPLRLKDETVALLEGMGAIAATAEDAETARIENFVPRFGSDITEHTLPQETQQIHALHFQKGCYLGQEIVERIRSRGHVNKLLMGFRAAAQSLPERGARISIEGQPAGEVTSAAGVGDRIFGLAYVRAPGARSGAMAELDGRAIELLAPHS